MKTKYTLTYYLTTLETSLDSIVGHVSLEFFRGGGPEFFHRDKL